jgi:hypothetical protein
LNTADLTYVLGGPQYALGINSVIPRLGFNLRDTL